jgi:hypothetical protein
VPRRVVRAERAQLLVAVDGRVKEPAHERVVHVVDARAQWDAGNWLQIDGAFPRVAPLPA